MGSLRSLPLSLEALDGLDGVDTLCLFIFEDERPLRGLAGFVDWRLSGRLSRLLEEGTFEGKRGELLLMPPAGKLPTPRLLLVGGGVGRRLQRGPIGEAVSGKEAAEKAEAPLTELLEEAARILSRAKVGSVGVEPPGTLVPAKRRLRLLKERFVAGLGSRDVTVLSEEAEVLGATGG